MSKDFLDIEGYHIKWVKTSLFMNVYLEPRRARGETVAPR